MALNIELNMYRSIGFWLTHTKGVQWLLNVNAKFTLKKWTDNQATRERTAEKKTTINYVCGVWIVHWLTRNTIKRKHNKTKRRSDFYQVYAIFSKCTMNVGVEHLSRISVPLNTNTHTHSEIINRSYGAIIKSTVRTTQIYIVMCDLIKNLAHPNGKRGKATGIFLQYAYACFWFGRGCFFLVVRRNDEMKNTGKRKQQSSHSLINRFNLMAS